MKTSLGFIGSATSVALPFIDMVTPVVQLTGAILGVALTVVTLRLQYLRTKELTDKRD